MREQRRPSGRRSRGRRRKRRPLYRKIRRRWRRGGPIVRAQMILAGAASAVAAALLVTLFVTAVFRMAGQKGSTEGQAVREELSGETAAAGNGALQASGLQMTETDGNMPASAAESPAAVITPEPEPVATAVTVTCVGDCTFARDSNAEYDMSFTEAYDTYGPDYFFDNVRDIFTSDDLTIVNFEGTLTESEDRTENRFAFKGPASYTQILTGSGVEAANLANNHSFDYGEQGFEDTKAALDEAGIRNFGYDRSIVMDVNGIKVGLIGLLELYEEMGIEDLLIRQLEYVKQEGAQLIICSFHWGDEKSYEPTDIQYALAHSAIDHGADLVIGHHPHVLQGTEIYNGKMILYSLGNFCFGGNLMPYDMDSAIYQQTFTFTDGVLDGNEPDYRFIPVRVTSAQDYNNYQPTVAEGEAARRIDAKLSGHAYDEDYSEDYTEEGE